jgi:hypothetical protein
MRKTTQELTSRQWLKSGLAGAFCGSVSFPDDGFDARLFESEFSSRNRILRALQRDLTAFKEAMSRRLGAAVEIAVESETSCQNQKPVL